MRFFFFSQQAEVGVRIIYRSRVYARKYGKHLKKYQNERGNEIALKFSMKCTNKVPQTN